LNEFDLIAKYFAPIAAPEGQGLRDDAAHFSPTPGFDLVITKDTMVEGVHFPSGEYGSGVAERLLRVNLSDLAAKAASPRGYLLSVAWPKTVPVEIMGEFAKGLKTAGDKFGIGLWGGDTVMSEGPAVFSATLIGECPQGMSVKRRGARPGDDIWLSGFLGKGYFGLRAITESRENSDIFYRLPPRLELKSLLRTYASSAIDISDGFVADLTHLADASHVKMQVDVETMHFPADVSKWLESSAGDIKTLLTHGDDYEILFTAHAEYRSAIQKKVKELPFAVTRVGKCDLGRGAVVFENETAMNFETPGYTHF